MKVKVEFELEVSGDVPEQISEAAATAIKDALQTKKETERRVGVAPGIEAIVTVIP